MIEGRCHCGACGWTYEGVPPFATACNCTICRRYGAFWGYGWLGEAVQVRGTTRAYMRDVLIEFRFCPECGCLGWYQAAEADPSGRRKVAVNLRMAEPEAVRGVAVNHFDGLGAFEDMPRDGRCVGDYWV